MAQGVSKPAQTNPEPFGGSSVFWYDEHVRPIRTARGDAMLEFLAVCVLIIVAFVLAIGAVVLVPLMLVGLLLKLLIQLVVLPFRVLGWLFAGAVGIAAAGVKVFIGLGLLVGGLLFLPLLPILFAVGLIWLFVRLLRPRPAFG